MTRLFIENYELDLTNDYSHQLTFSVDDLNNFDSKSTAFSKTIILPATSKNNRLLGNIFEFSNSNFTNDAEPNVLYNFNASKSAKTRLEVNGLLVMKGVMRLLQIVIDGQVTEYEVALFGELGGFVAKLGAKKITDNVNATDNLDFSEYNHVYDRTNILDTWNLGSGILITSATFRYFDFDAWLGLPSGTTGIAPQNQIANLTGLQLSNFQIGDTINVSGSISSDGTYTIIGITMPTYIFSGCLIVQETLPTTPVNETNFFIEISGKQFSMGYRYPLIDYGEVSTNKHDYKYTAFRPALYLREYIDKIITNAGYTWESNFMNTAFFKRLIIPNNQNYLRINRSNIGIFGAGMNGSIWWYGTEEFTMEVSYAGLFTASGNELTYTSTQTFNGNINITIGGSWKNYGGSCNNSYAYGTIAIYKNGLLYYYDISKSFGGYPNNIYVGTQFSINLSIPVTLVNGDIIAFESVVYDNPCPVTFQYNIGANVRFDTPSPILSPAILGDYIRINETLPRNIYQKDLFTSVIKMFNLMVTEDKYKEKHLVIEPFINFYNLDPSSYLDWSLKVDRSQPIKIKPMSEINARYYELKYKSDTDYYNDKYRKTYAEGYGDRVFDNQLEFAKDSQSTEVIFSATTLLGYNEEDKVVSTIFKLNKSGTEYTEETINHNIRILQLNHILDVEQWKMLDLSENTIEERTDYLYAGHFDDPDVPSADINFGATKELYFNLVSGALGNNLFNTYYSSYLAEITDKDSRLVTCKMKLTESDIHNLNFGKFIYIDGVLYRLQKISDYANGELSEVQLLRVIYTTYADMTSSPDITECLEEETSVCIIQENNFNISIE